MRDWYYLLVMSTNLFKRDKNIGNFLVRSSFQTNDQSGTFKCARSRCKTCPFVHNVEKISGHKRSIRITDHFTCTSAIVIYCIACTYCQKLIREMVSFELGKAIKKDVCRLVTSVGQDDISTNITLSTSLIL